MKSPTILGQMKVSQALPLMRIVAKQWALPLTLQRSWNICTRIINHSIKNN